MKNYLIGLLLVGSLITGILLSRWSHSKDEELETTEEKLDTKDNSFKQLEDSILQAKLKMYKDHNQFLDSIIVELKKINLKLDKLNQSQNIELIKAKERPINKYRYDSLYRKRINGFQQRTKNINNSRLRSESYRPKKQID